MKRAEISGFLTFLLIKRDYNWNIKTHSYAKLSRYRIKDNYVRYFLKYIEPNMIRINEGRFLDKKLTGDPSWYTKKGLQFENLVLNNRSLIYKKLGLVDGEVLVSGPYFQNKTTTSNACQIDMLIQTETKNLFVCEIKSSIRTITINASNELKDKIKKLKKPKDFACIPVLIYFGEISEEIENEDFIYKLIDFSEFLEGK